MLDYQILVCLPMLDDTAIKHCIFKGKLYKLDSIRSEKNFFETLKKEKLIGVYNWLAPVDLDTNEEKEFKYNWLHYLKSLQLDGVDFFVMPASMEGLRVTTSVSHACFSSLFPATYLPKLSILKEDPIIYNLLLSFTSKTQCLCSEKVKNWLLIITEAAYRIFEHFAKYIGNYYAKSVPVYSDYIEEMITQFADFLQVPSDLDTEDLYKNMLEVLKTTYKAKKISKDDFNKLSAKLSKISTLVNTGFLYSMSFEETQFSYDFRELLNSKEKVTFTTNYTAICESFAELVLPEVASKENFVYITTASVIPEDIYQKYFKKYLEGTLDINGLAQNWKRCLNYLSEEDTVRLKDSIYDFVKHSRELGLECVEFKETATLLQGVIYAENCTLPQKMAEFESCMLKKYPKTAILYMSYLQTPTMWRTLSDIATCK